MAIDSPLDAFKQQYMQEEEKSPFGLAVLTGKIAFPKAALGFELFTKVRDRLSRASIDERLQAMWSVLVKEFEHVEDMKAEKEDVSRAMNFVMWRAAEEVDNKKRERYATLIGNAIKSPQQIKDVEGFVRTAEQLNDRDLAILKVINRVMNREGDWKPQHNPANPAGPIMTLHHSNIIGRAQEFSTQVAMELGQPIEKNLFNRDEGYLICTRLQGFGLACELEPMNMLPLTNYAYRLSARGATFLKLIGEKVPNYDHYTAQQAR